VSRHHAGSQQQGVCAKPHSAEAHQDLVRLGPDSERQPS